MDAEHAYMAAFLITGDHLEAERARAKARKQLEVCPICGNGFETEDSVDLYQGRYAHEECIVAGAEISYADCDLW